jgi:ethylmalonyl-CoA/methylmalonyl-CoA decarboxylase
VRGGVRWILLDHPRAHNALTATMMRRLAQEVRALQTFDGAVAVLASAGGGSFCAGGHLGQVRDGLLEPGAARAMCTHVGATLDAFAELPVVSISLVEGAAIGGGVELASATDLIVGTRGCYFDPAQVRLGVACGWGGAGRLARRLGPRAALRLLVTSRRISAEQAAAMGLVDALVDAPEDAISAVLGPHHVERISSIRAVKAQIAGHDRVEAFLGVWGGSAHRAALSALADR